MASTCHTPPCVKKDYDESRRVRMALHIENDLENITVEKGLFLYKVVTFSGYWIVVALHIFDTNCYSYSWSEGPKYGGPEVLKINMQK